jgi:hypothetical protein
MKRVVFAAVAAMTVLGQVQFAAAAGKDDVANDPHKVERAARDAKDAAGAPAMAKSLIASVSQAKYTLDATSSRNLNAVLSVEDNGRVRDLVADITSSTDESLKTLNTELLKAAAGLKGININVDNTALQALDVNARNEQNAVSMILGAGKQAKNWSADTRANYLLLLQSFNARRAEGKSPADALVAAAKDLQNAKKVTINLDDLRKLCEG